MAITYFDPKTARGSVDSGRCLRARFRNMGEVCTLVLFIGFSEATKICRAVVWCIVYMQAEEVGTASRDPSHDIYVLYISLKLDKY